MSSWLDLLPIKLTLRQKIAQMLSSRVVSHFVSSESSDYRRVEALVRDVGIGGITFFQGTVPGQAFYTNRLQALAAIPLLVAQDAENGIGMRLDNATVLPHMMAVGATGDIENAYRASEVTAREARALGVHHVFAPVGDVNTNPQNPIINTRSYGSEPHSVAAHVVESIRALQDNRVIATVKHFPGHGDTAIDTHLNLATLPFGRDRLDDIELVPFRAAFHAGVRSCMVGHLSVPELDPSGVPASLSFPIVTGLLREQLGFEGLIVTDALDMQAVTNTYGAGEAAVMAVEAGVDMLLLVADEYEAIDAIENAVTTGRLREDRIDDSVGRIFGEKEWCGLHNREDVSMNAVFSTVACEDHLAVSEQIAAAAICSLGDRKGVDALSTGSTQLLVSIIDDPCSKSGHVFEERLQGFATETVTISPTTSQADLDACISASDRYDATIVAVYLSVRSYSGSISFPANILSTINALVAKQDTIVVLFGSPYVYDLLEVSCSCIATCSTSPASEIAAANLLIKGGLCPGTLPVVL